ncbi:putative Multiple C2 and transmembrane domain-containing protein 1 [Hypsibius exemplaris]|uniref:Multiple C2 and transmembrane domain-containing protein 1 n=1 Tax=Hypsibius exemplaris TaxID=2072580 RepID=A0A9X6RLW9_HYPEX|nr:putative Multiple C2 and transmembrane domain-containing protein 1 [Hypsibius exemplaris]
MDVSVLGAADPPTSTPISTSTSNIDAHAAAISGVTVFLFEGKRFAVSDEPGGNPFCEFTLGRENYRSYTAAGTDIDPENPQWMEEFDLFLHDPRQLQLHVTVCNSRLAGTKSDVIGKGVVDLTKLECGKSEEIWLDVMTSSQEVAGSLHLSFTLGKRLLTINTLKDGLLPEHILMQQIYLREKFHPLNTLRMAADSDVGVLIVKILRAKDIMPDRTNRDKTVVCSAQLVNARLDTFARTGTSDPEWNCVFTFPVRDVHTDLFISLWCPGVDGRARKDFLGGTAVRLTEIENGKPRWSALKDKNLRTDVGGSVLVNASLIYNPIAAAMKSIGRKEARFGREEKQTISLKSFSYDVQRVKNVVAPLVDLGRTAR